MNLIRLGLKNIIFKTTNAEELVSGNEIYMQGKKYYGDEVLIACGK
jgi:hypothetical protein